MFRGNKEYFILKRQLVDEAKEKMLTQLTSVEKVKKQRTTPLDDDDDDEDYIDLTDEMHNSASQPITRFKSMLKNMDPSSTTSALPKDHFQVDPEQVLNKRLVYVYEWCDDNTAIYGFGCNRAGVACYLPINVTPGLFVVSSNVPMLRRICKLHQCLDVFQYMVTYDCNNFGVWDLFNNYHRVTNSECYLVKIVTPTMQMAQRIYNKFKYDTSAYHYACVQQYFDITKLVMFELLVRRMHRENLEKKTNGDCSQLDYSVPKTVMQWFDVDLNVYTQYEAPQLPIITFDIETVSDDPHRVPTGDHPTDILYTTSIHHIHTNTLYTLIYLPLKNRSAKEMKAMVYNVDGYQILPSSSLLPNNLINIVECFTTEIDLLQRSMDLLTLPNNQLHILCGYNSISYDIKYLLMRCFFYNMIDSMAKFVWREGYCYGWSQIHLDLFRIIVSRYRFKSYTLNNVSKEIIKDSKTGVSAVNLRFSFFRMLETQKFFKHNDDDPEFDRFPSVRDTLHYNNADTLLVSKLETETKSLDFIIRKAMSCQVPLTTMTTNYNTMQYKLWNECFIVGLNMRLFLGTFKAPSAIIHCPVVSDAGPDDVVPLVINLTDRLNHAKNETRVPTMSAPTFAEMSEDSTSHVVAGTSVAKLQSYRDAASTANAAKKAEFPGGANFCLGAYDVNNVQMYDYVTAYPILMDRKNMSDETLTILPANILAMVYMSLVRQNCVDKFEVYDYMTHSGRSKSETAVLYYQYINNGLHCGGQFPFTLAELERRLDSLVIIIWTGRRGLLSQIIAKFTKTRAETKDMWKILEETCKMLEGHLQAESLKQQQLEADALEDSAAALNNIESETTTSNTPAETDDNGLFGLDDSDSDDNNNDTDTESTSSSKNSQKQNTKINACSQAASIESTSSSSLNRENKQKRKINNDNDNDVCIESTVSDKTNNGKDIVSTNVVDTSSAGMFGIDDDDDNDDNANDSSTNAGNGAFGFGSDDDSDEDNNGSGKNDSEEEEEEDDTLTRQCRNTYGFEFVNEYVNVYGDQIEINEEKLATASDPSQVLRNLMAAVALEQMKIRNSYELQKSLVSSIYGCVGKLIKVVAASITCLTRSTLLASAKYCTDVGRQVLYIDTDSIMTAAIDGINDGDNNDEDLSGAMNRMYPFMVMEMKVARKCMFVKRKTYYKVENGEIKYGQNVNGPTAWRRCVEYFYAATNIETCDDIQIAFFNFFKNCYTQLLEPKTITPEVIVNVTQTIQVQLEYKTQTVAAQYKEYLRKNYPELVDTHKHSVYYYLDTGSVTQSILRPGFELKDLRHVNLFKYYQHMYSTIFNLIKFTVRRNNAPFNVTISSKVVLLLMLRGFLDAHDDTFGSSKTVTQPNTVTSKSIDAALNSTNADDVETLCSTITVEQFEK